MTFSALKRRYADGAVSKPDFIRQSCVHHDVLFEYAEMLAQTDIVEVRIGRDGVEFVIGEERIQLTTPRHEARVAPIEILNFDRYEPFETRLFDMMAARATGFLDIGANIGYFSVRAAKRDPDLTIYAFEPLPRSFEYLQRNVARNRVGNQVVCFGYGLSESNGAAEFYSDRLNGTNASLLNVANASNPDKFVGFVMRLDDWVDGYKADVDLIKCDVEGAELMVFRGADRTLRTQRPMIITEMLRKWSQPFGYHPNDMIGHLSAFGYDCYAIGEGTVRLLGSVEEHTVETNYLFLHPQKHQDLITQLPEN